MRWLGLLGFADGRDGFHVEFFVVGVARYGVDLEAFYKQDADADVRLFVRRKPDLVVYEFLLHDEAGAFLEIRKKASGEFHVADEIGFEPGYVMGLFVDPDDAGKFLDNFFNEFVRLEFRIGLEVEDQDILAAKAFAPGIYELRDVEEDFDAWFVIVFFALTSFLVLLFLGVSLGLSLLDIFDFLLCGLVFLLLLVCT